MSKEKPDIQSTYAGLDDYAVREEGKGPQSIKVLMKNGNDCKCPLVPPVYTMPNIEGGNIQKLIEPCNSMCPKFSFGKKTIKEEGKDAVEYFVVRHTCMATMTEYPLSNVVDQSEIPKGVQLDFTKGGKA
jgi:hypothetical protein